MKRLIAFLVAASLLAVPVLATTSYVDYGGSGYFYAQTDVYFGWTDEGYPSHLTDTVEIDAGSYGGYHTIASDGTTVTINRELGISDGYASAGQYADTYWLTLGSGSYIDTESDGGISNYINLNDHDGYFSQNAWAGSYFSTGFGWDDKTDVDGTSLGISGSEGWAGMGTNYISGGGYSNDGGGPFLNTRYTEFGAEGTGTFSGTHYTGDSIQFNWGHDSLADGTVHTVDGATDFTGTINQGIGFDSSIYGSDWYCANSENCV